MSHTICFFLLFQMCSHHVPMRSCPRVPPSSQVVPEDVLNSNSVFIPYALPKVETLMYLWSKEGRPVCHLSAPTSLNKCEQIVGLLFSSKLLLRSLQSTIFCSSLFPLPLSLFGLFLPPPSTPNLSPRTVCSPSLALSIFFTSFTCLSCRSHLSSLLTFSLSEYYVHDQLVLPFTISSSRAQQKDDNNNNNNNFSLHFLPRFSV